MDTLARDLFALKDTALGLLRQNPAAEQVIALKTAKNTVRSFCNNPSDGLRQAENDFLQALAAQEDPQVVCLVCMWNGGSVDVPSYHFRQQLMALSPKNGEAFVLLQGEKGPIAKKLKELF